MKGLLLVLAVLLPLRAALGVAPVPMNGQLRQLASWMAPAKSVDRSEERRAGSAEARDGFGLDGDLGPLSTWTFGSAAPMQPRLRPASALPKFSFIWVPPERPPRFS